MDWRDIWRLIICTISCKYPEIPENISPLLSGYEQTNRTKWLFLVGQYSLGIVHLMMTLTSLLWSAGLQLKLCHKDTSVSYYSASAAANCSHVLFMTELNGLQQSVLKNMCKMIYISFHTFQTLRISIPTYNVLLNPTKYIQLYLHAYSTLP